MQAAPYEQVHEALRLLDHRRVHPVDRWMVEEVAKLHDDLGAEPHEFVRWTNEDFADLDGHLVLPAAMGRRLNKLLALHVLELDDETHPWGPRPRGSGGSPIRVNGDFPDWALPWRRKDPSAAFDRLDHWAVTHPYEENAWCYPGSLARSTVARSSPFIARGTRRYARLSARSIRAGGAEPQRITGQTPPAADPSTRAMDARWEGLIARLERAMSAGPAAAPSVLTDPSDLSWETERATTRERAAAQEPQSPKPGPGGDQTPAWVTDAMASITAALAERGPFSLWGGARGEAVRSIRAIGPEFAADAACAHIAKRKSINRDQVVRLCMEAIAAGRPKPPRPEADVIDLVTPEPEPEPTEEDKAAAAAARATARALLKPGTTSRLDASR